MYLARAYLSPVSRVVRADLADPVSLHRTVMRAFPDDTGPRAREAHGVLHRIDRDTERDLWVLLVQSSTRPDFARLPVGYFLEIGDDFESAPGARDNPAIREVGEQRGRIAVGDSFVFRLRANTTHKIPKIDKATGNRTKNGTRVPLRGDEARLSWLTRRAVTAGFTAGDVRITEVPAVSSRKGGVTLAGAVFEGRLSVTDVDAFQDALRSGIGPGKAFGFGLLSIQQAG